MFETILERKRVDKKRVYKGSENVMKKILEIMKKILIGMIIGGVIGLIIGIILAKSEVEIINFKIENLIVIFLCFCATYFIQITVHEAGHLFFGLISGYSFVSFRIGTFTIVKENNTLAIKKFKIEGTGGQCLMMPKTEDYKQCKFFLYNIGGVIMNFVVAMLGLLIWSFYQNENEISDVFFFLLALTGIALGFMNGIPLKMSGIPNDGYNIFLVSKNDLMKSCFFIQLKINGLLSQGIRMKEMPIEWFQLPNDVDYNNPLICAIKGLEASYYHDKLEFDEAKKCYEELLQKGNHIPKLYENEIHCELLFYEIIGEKRKEVIDKIYTKELEQYVKRTSCYLQRKRLMYAYYGIIKKDIERANKELEQFYKLIKTYPSKGQIEEELEVVTLVKKLLVE